MSERTPSEIERDLDQTRAQMSGTLEAIQEKLSPGELMDQVLDYLRDNGGELGHHAGEFARGLGRSVRDNPVPTLLVGTGLVWMMVAHSRRRRHSYEPIDEYDRFEDEDDWTDHYGGVGAGDDDLSGHPATAGGDAATLAAEAAVRARARAQRAAGEAHARAGDGAQGVSGSGSAHGFGERAGEMAHDVRERIDELAESARGRFARARSGVRHGLGAAGHRMRSGARRAGRSARYGAQRTGGGVAEMWREQPLLFGVVGVAVGALMGALLPVTRREDDWLGESGDELRHQAAARARTALDKAEQVVEGATEAGMAEAERQGLTPDAAAAKVKEAERAVGDRVTELERAAGNKLDEAEDKLRKVGQAVTDAAKAEAERQDPSERPSGPFNGETETSATSGRP